LTLLLAFRALLMGNPSPPATSNIAGFHPRRQRMEAQGGGQEKKSRRARGGGSCG